METITTKNFIKKVADAAGTTQKDAKLVIDAISDVVLDEVAAGNKIKAFKGIYFEGVNRPARTCRNPLNGETIQVPAKVAPKCTFTKGFKDLVSGVK